MLESWLMLPLKDIVPPYSLTAKLAQERLIQWLEKTKFMQDKFINQMKGKVSFQEQYNSFGEKLNLIRANFQSKLHIQKSTISKLKISSIFNLVFFIADGIQQTDFLLRILLLWIAQMLMIWLPFYCKEWETERVDHMRWIKIQVEVIRLWLFI